MVVSILSKYGNEVDSLTLIPSGGGVYKIWKNDDLVFSKKELGRFPHSDDEVIDKF